MTAELILLMISFVISTASLMGYVKAQITHLHARIDELADVRERLARIETKLDNIKQIA